MPIKNCKSEGKPGYSWGNSSKCWTYTPGDEASQKKAKKACIRQAIAIEGPEKFAAIQRGDSKGSDQSVLSDIINDPESTLNEVVCAAEVYQGGPLEQIIINEIIEAKKMESGSTQASVLKSISDEGKKKLQSILAALRAQEQLYYTCHWQAAGSTFYCDHLLFERLYGSQASQYDGLAEKLVCAFGKEVVNIVEQIELQEEFLEEWVKPESAIEKGLASEKELQTQIKSTYDFLKDKNELPPGLDDYLLALADDHDTNLYLLGQETKGK